MEGVVVRVVGEGENKPLDVLAFDDVAVGESDSVGVGLEDARPLELGSECLGDELAACSTVDEGSALVSLYSGLEDEEVGVADLCDLHVSALLVVRPASTLGRVLRSGERGGVGVLGNLLCRGLSLEGLEGFLRAGGTGTC